MQVVEAVVAQDQGGQAALQLLLNGRAAGGAKVHRVHVVPLPVGQEGGVQVQDVEPVPPWTHVNASRVQAVCSIDWEQGACHGAVAAEALQQRI